MRTNHPAFSHPRAARLSPLAAALAFALAPAAEAATLLVDTAADDGGLTTLRMRIIEANTNCAGDPSPTIAFSGAFTINTSSQLPAFECFTGIGAYNPTVDGNVAGGKVTVRGSTFATCGLGRGNFSYGGTLTVTGMKLQAFTYGTLAAGVCGQSLGVSESEFTGNSVGALLQAGGSSTVATSVFTNNSNAGIYSIGANSSLSNNLVGTPDGTNANGNGTGIYIGGGGSAFLSGNTISGNDGVGVSIRFDSNTQLQNNVIGITSGGDVALPNGGGGVLIDSSNNINIYGGAISGNNGAGISISNSDSVGISNVKIGMGTEGQVIPNTRGVDAFCSGYVNIFNSTVSHNQFEGLHLTNTSDGFIGGNTINNNGGTGVRITDGFDCSSPDRNFLFDNEIRANGQNGILLLAGYLNLIYGGSITGNTVKNISINGGSSPLPNDPGDDDDGPNGQMNYPVITSVVHSGGQTIIDFTLDSNSSNNLEIQAYANTNFGKPAGETFIGETSLCGDCSEYSGTITVDGLYDNISLTATDDNSSDGTSEFSPMKAALSAPAVSIAPNPLDFGDVPVNGTSPSRTVLIRSLGDQPYVIDTIDQYGGSCLPADQRAFAAAAVTICYGGAFTCSTTCSTDTSYAKNQSCTLTASFSPFFSGFQDTRIYFCDNTADTPHIITLQGNGVAPPPIKVTPSAWDFGDVLVGTASAPNRFTISNSDEYGGDIEITTTGEFDIVGDDCGGSVPGNGSCHVTVEFVPTQSGEAQGELRVAIDVSEKFDKSAFTNPVAKASLRGNGVAGGVLTLPEALDVGAAIVGGANATRTIELVNNGTDPVSFASLETSANFSVVNNCPEVLLPGQACTLTITFVAPGVGPFTGTLTVVTNAAGGSGVIALTALGQTSAAPLLRLVPTAIGFGDRVIGSQSANQPVTITNIGGAAATLGLASSTIDFVISSTTCGATLEPQASCFAQVAFRPLLGFGTRTGSFIVSSNAANSPQAVNLSGTGCRPFIASGNRSGDSSSCAP